MLEPPKHWDFGGIVHRRTSSGNSSEGDNSFSLMRFVKRARRSRTSRTSDDGDAPPLPPPKDGQKRSFSPSNYSTGLSHLPRRSTSTEGSNGSRRDTNDVYSKPRDVNFTLAEIDISRPPKLGLNSQSSSSPPVPSPLPHKFRPFRPQLRPPMKIPTPEERAKARIEAEREKELETLLTTQQEEERQARIKAEKEEQRRREEEEEARRKAKTEQDIRIAQLLKHQREHEQAKADEKFAQEVEERRKANKEKRLQENYKSQACRIEREKSKEKMLHEKEEAKKRREEEKMRERKRLFHTMKDGQPGGLELSEWISVQSAGTVTWRRRWFIFDGKTLSFFKAQTDASPVDIIAVSDIRSVRDGGGPSEEEPAFIPNSFVVEEVHGCCWFFFTDTPETKEKVMATLLFSRGVRNANHP